MTEEAVFSAATRDAPIEAIYFDGGSNARHRVILKPAACLDIEEEGHFLAAWAYGDIRRADGPEGVLRLRNIAAAPLARIEIRDPAAQAEIARLCTLLDGEGAPGDGSTRRIVFWSIAATVSLVCIIWFGIPLLADRLAPIVPVFVEKRLGDASEGQMRVLFGNNTCSAPDGTLAFRKLIGKLQDKAQLLIPPRPEVISSPIPNAFALPGGKVYVLSRLIEKAETPDELAAVLAHEFGHIAHRDGVRRVIADGSTSFLAGLLFGDVTGAGVMLAAGRALFSSAYSREAEANADLYAKNLMLQLDRPPQALGTLMLRIIGNEKNNPLSIFATHPLTEDRIAALADAQAPADGPPLLSDVEWKSLKAICETPKGADPT